MAKTQDNDLLVMAIRGYEVESARLTNKILEIRQRLASTGAVLEEVAPRIKKKHRISAAGRARIAAAQRLRWAKTKRNSRRGRKVS